MKTPVRNDRLRRDYHVTKVMIYTSKIEFKWDPIIQVKCHKRSGTGSV